mmetsp:Transcript_38266/g.67159  ORF Transcript_38266/g.67159 Transcript_38266/m.67159 type:complete len:837 (-) Transcript_38266:111-2621(-)
MVEGDKWELYIPSDLAYGSRGSPPTIPGDSALVFTIEMIEIQGEKVIATVAERICGSNYNDALSNCLLNTQCPNGDGCEFGDACFTIPASECPTVAPTEAPTPTPKVCGVDALDAQAHCLIYSKRCSSEDLCGIGEACFNVPDYLCGMTQKPTDRPTNEPTPEPTPKVCGSNELSAQANCLDMSKRCPSGNGCGQGEACFTVSKNVCGLVEDPEESAAAMDEAVEPTVSQTTESFFKVCGVGYADAATNCKTNAKCPSGDGCANGATCFALPPASCSESVPVTTPNPTPMQVINTNTPTPRPTPKPTTPEPTTMNPTAKPSENPTAKPSEDPTAMKLPMVPTVPPIPERLNICGEDYNDAAQNFCSNPTCPTGGVCANGGVCYALPYVKCSDEANTNNDEEDEEDEPTRSPSHSHYPTLSPSTSLMPSYPPTHYPTQSPIFNTNFCGETYELAEENCWLAERCPSGSGCSKTGESCYPISLPRCLSAAPTDAPTGPGPRPSASPTVSLAPSVSPTVSTSPTDLPSGIPTKAPVVNTNFCGNTYNEAVEKCAEATPCPNDSCPGELVCFVGIACAATAPFLPDLTPGQPTDSSDDSTLTAPTPSQPGDSEITTSTPRPTMNWLEAIGISGSTQTSSQPTPTNERYCGLNIERAQNRCAMAIPCSDGLSDVCLDGETCFGIGGTCAASTVFPPTSNTLPAPLTSTPSPSTSPNIKHVFDPDATSFCGYDYNDARDNCYANKACPSGAIEVCPNGQTCYTGIMNCETPPPTMSLVPTNVVAGEGTPTSSPTKKPTDEPQISPDWDWDASSYDSGSGSCMPGLILRSFVMGGVILGALVI